MTYKLKQAARLSVAPMMDWTDRHCRYFHRVISQETLLYTEMVTAPALVRGGALHLLRYNPQEHPLVLQLGGSDPAELARAAQLGAEAGYDEINLNCGCPSDRVQSGTFGAILMEDPERVASCVRAMQETCGAVPVTVKCRLGIDDQDLAQTLPRFIDALVDVATVQITIHARKAWLKGLSPKENRDIPPLDYQLAYQMKERHPALTVSVNGGIESLEQSKALLQMGFDGVMIGRAAYHRPFDILGRADQDIYNAQTAPKTRVAIVEEMRPYIEAHLDEGGKLAQIIRHMLGLFTGEAGARQWRRILSEEGHKTTAGWDVVARALQAVQEAQLSSCDT